MHDCFVYPEVFQYCIRTDKYSKLYVGTRNHSYGICWRHADNLIGQKKVSVFY